MACFGVLCFLTCCSSLLLIHQTFATPTVIEAYKPKRNGGTTQMKTGTNRYIKNVDDLNAMFKNLQHRIDEAEVRQKLMEAQMQFPFAFKPGKANRMAAAFQLFLNTKIPSVIYNASTISSVGGIFIQIFEDGTVNGTMDINSPYAKLTLESVDLGGTYRIKGTKSQKYLVYKKNGRVVAESDVQDPDESIFHNVYAKGTDFVFIKNEKYKWYLDFRHNLKLKKGPRINWRRKNRIYNKNGTLRMGIPLFFVRAQIG